MGGGGTDFIPILLYRDWSNGTAKFKFGRVILQRLVGYPGKTKKAGLLVHTSCTLLLPVYSANPHKWLTVHHTLQTTHYKPHIIMSLFHFISFVPGPGAFMPKWYARWTIQHTQCNNIRTKRKTNYYRHPKRRNSQRKTHECGLQYNYY